MFPQGAVHMLHNTGDEEMKVVCFFAPPTNLDNYKLYEDVDFPDWRAVHFRIAQRSPPRAKPLIARARCIGPQIQRS